MGVNAENRSVRFPLDLLGGSASGIPQHKTINGESIIGEGDITIEAGSGLTPWQESYLQKAEESERAGKFAATLTIAPTASEFDGQTVALTITAAGSYDGKAVDVAVTAPGLTFEAGKAEAVWTPPAVSQGQVAVSYTAVISYTDEAGTIEKTATAAQSRYAPIRWVSSPSADLPTSDQILAGAKTVKASPAGEYAIHFTPGHYLWLCFPAFMKPRAFTSAGFAVPVEAPQPAICRIGSTDVSYTCIRLSGAPKTSPINIKIA